MWDNLQSIVTINEAAKRNKKVFREMSIDTKKGKELVKNVSSDQFKIQTTKSKEFTIDQF